MPGPEPSFIRVAYLDPARQEIIYEMPSSRPFLDSNHSPGIYPASLFFGGGGLSAYRNGRVRHARTFDPDSIAAASGSHANIHCNPN